MVDEIKVTVIATGSIGSNEEVTTGLGAEIPAAVEETPEPLWRRQAGEDSPAPEAETAAMQRPVFAAAEESQTEEKPEKVPFYRKVLAHSHESDKGGFGPNWSNVDDYDIPTVLRKQLD